MQTVQHRVSNGDGWTISLYQTWSADHLESGRRPVLIVPGYGMNSFIFSYHPRGLSLEGFLAQAGLEVWRVDLRAQGESSSNGPDDRSFGMAELALTDLGVAIDTVLARSQTGATSVDTIGASLGGTLTLTHAVLNPRHRMGSLVVMGTPIRWVKVHPVVKLAFGSPLLAGAVRLRGTRRLAELLLPFFARRAPWLLSFYINPALSDLDAAREMVRTVEDPQRYINRQISHWIRARDLMVRGRNVAEGLRQITSPLLCVVANGDGVVPRPTAAFAYQQVSSPAKQLLEVGTPDQSHAHADLFVSNEAHQRVFAPIATWLKAQAAPR